MSKRRRVRGAHGGFALLFASIWAAAADVYPSKPVRVVVPFTVGGTTDISARIVSQALAVTTGYSFIVDNRPGAGGNIGSAMVAKSSPDGYTLLYGTISTYVLNVGLYSSLPYDPVKDLTPVGLTALVPILVIVAPTLGVHDYAGLIRKLRAEPGRHSYGSAGSGTSAHLACHLLLQMTGTKAEHIPYKGNVPALNDIMAGRVTFGVASPASSQGFIRQGRLVPVAAISPKRFAAFPDVPTTNEVGLKGYDAYAWNAITAPAATPAVILDKMNAELRKTLADAGVARQLDAQGLVPTPDYDRAQSAAFMQRELEKWVPIVRGSGARPD